ncbi:NUDIX hydrolase [Sediminibacillus massiliensis]|uniref:NUDIX hydrolase n=1 Tax=Sediminibacillus massiliensis TaxID=1926277 RepID=UPI0009884147|nr:NUDIX hydrolase [Sediminibacillus massiliensis]
MDYISYLRSMVGHEKVIMVVAGVLVFDLEDRILLHLRADNQSWGLPGGFMEMGETVSETARREVFEETGLRLGSLELFSLYSGPKKEKTLPSGDEVAMVQLWFTCKDFQGDLVKENEESLDTGFFALDNLPEKLFSSHAEIIEEYLSGKQFPIID